MGGLLHFDGQDWERIERDYAAWWAQELERPLVQVLGRVRDASDPYPEFHSFVSNYPLEMPAEEVIAAVTRDLWSRRYYGDAFPRWWPNFGPGIMAGFLGAQVNNVPDTVWFSPAAQRKAAEIRLAYQPENPWWLRIQALTRVAVETWGRDVQVAYTDLGGNLDILASLLTTEGLLYDLYDAPEEVERLVGEITRLWLRYYDELESIIRSGCRGTVPWAPIWAQGTSYMLQCDFAYMISPEMFERFVVPDLVACCDHLEYGFYHLDGAGQIPHLRHLLDIPRLRGIQWVAGDGAPGLQEWLGLLKRIIDGGKLCQLFLNAEEALAIVRNLGGKGFLFAIREEMTVEEAEAFLRLLAREDASRTG